MKLDLPLPFTSSNDPAFLSPFDTIIRDLNIKTLAGREFLRIALENVRLMDAKQQDYGSRNISGFGTFGVIVRANDKFERIKHMMANKRRRAVNEAMVDSFRDISNYMIIALMLEQKVWPNE